ncbi:hypothetical protein AB0N46_29325 [Streptomyces albidoflavus]|uniref:hypothetical protein n=1 Tax=Streptomyces albidoflavus TaxID=1886 RepID=UPI003423526F
MTTGLTLAGLALSLAIFWANFRPWWKGSREAKALLPFGQGFILGAVSTVCAGGLLGWLAGCAATAANQGGDKATLGVTGAGAAQPLARGTLGDLTPEGAVLVLLLTVGVILAWRAAGKAERKRVAGGAFVGATLCLTAGVASLLSWLPDTLNQGGGYLRMAVEGAGIL